MMVRCHVDVLAWNERAILVYERAGFERGTINTRRLEGGAAVPPDVPTGVR
jgi:RimJ/RimL family protein N-acetyltransferase